MNFDSQRVFEINRAPLHLFSMSMMVKIVRRRNMATLDEDSSILFPSLTK